MIPPITLIHYATPPEVVASRGSVSSVHISDISGSDGREWGDTPYITPQRTEPGAIRAIRAKSMFPKGKGVKGIKDNKIKYFGHSENRKCCNEPTERSQGDAPRES